MSKKTNATREIRTPVIVDEVEPHWYQVIDAGGIVLCSVEVCDKCGCCKSKKPCWSKITADAIAKALNERGKG
jgi:hypothetical protein